MNRSATVLSLLACIALAGGWFWRKKPAPMLEAPPKPHIVSLEEKLNTIIIPDYPTSEVALEEAVEVLRVKSREFDTTSADSGIKGVNIVIVAGGERKLPASSGLNMHGMPLAEALRHITGLVGLKYTVERHAVAIREQNEPRVPIYQKTTSLQNHMEKRILPTVQFQDASLEEALEYLLANRGCYDMGYKIPPPLNYALHLREGVKRTPISLALHDIPLDEALRYCAEISNVRLRYDPFAVMVTDLEDVTSAAIPPNSLILPTVALQGATLAESLDFIRIKSREISPDHSEVNIVVKPGSGDTSISLDLKGIPLSEALRYIAELSGHTLAWDGRSYVFTLLSSK